MKGILVCLFACFCLQAFAQVGSNGVRYITKFSGFEFGMAYPYLTKGYGYKLNNSHFNYGLSGHFNFGRIYDSRIVLSCEPGLFFSSIGETEFIYEDWDEVKDRLVYRNVVTNQHQILFFQLPAFIEFPLGKKVRWGGGPVFTIPFGGSGYYTEYYKHLNYQFPFYETGEYEDAYAARFELRLGFYARVLFSIHENEKAQKYIGLSYFQELGSRYPGGENIKSFTVSFISRNIVVKEVRQKWDRYLLRHD